MSTTTTTITTPHGFWSALYGKAIAIWHSAVDADAEVRLVLSSHPEVIAAADALEAAAPASVRLGIDTATHVAMAVNDIILHSQDVGIPASVAAAKATGA